jgi:lipid-binding SYLF domain-containing protein
MRLLTLVLLFVASVVLSIAVMPAVTASAATEIEDDVHATLQNLYTAQPVAKTLGEKAKAILVFPRIVKGGLIIGGQYGEGALVKDGRILGYYNSVAASYGLQVGGQTFGYALFLMNDKATAYLDSSTGWEIGVGPSVVIVDEGKAKALTTTTLRDDIYAFIFSQKGLMAGIGI